MNAVPPAILVVLVPRSVRIAPGALGDAAEFGISLDTEGVIDVIAWPEPAGAGTADVVFSAVVGAIRLPHGAGAIDLLWIGDVPFAVDADRSIPVLAAVGDRGRTCDLQDGWIDDTEMGARFHGEASCSPAR